MAKRALLGWERRTITGISAVSSLGWVVFILVSFGQVIARYVFQTPFQWAEELARFTLIWFSFICAIELTILDEHIDIDVFVPGGWMGKVFSLLKLLCIGATGFLLTFGTWKLLPVVSMSRLPATGLPLATLYLAATTAGVAFIVIAVLRVVALGFDTMRPVPPRI